MAWLFQQKERGSTEFHGAACHSVFSKEGRVTNEVVMTELERWAGARSRRDIRGAPAWQLFITGL